VRVYLFLDVGHLSNIYEFSPYLKENTTLHHYKDQRLTLFKEITAVYPVKQMIH
jgi:hypothetical protein